MTGEWRRLHSEKLHNVCPYQNIIQDDHSKEVEIGRACCMHSGFYLENLKERDTYQKRV
jgi:hypothetical protein